MGIDASAIARVLGITTTFKDRGGSVHFLPQRIYVIAQGRSDSVYPATKWEAPSAGAAGARYGYGSPIHLVLRELKPVNGDGVETIPVTVFPLSDAPSSTVASGSITPSGTATLAGEYRVRISGIQSSAFVIPAGAVNVTNACAAMGQAISSVLEMPMKVGYTYGAVTASALTGTGNGTLTAMTVTGTPLPGAWKLTVNAAVANGGVWTLTDPNGTVISTTLTQTVGAGTATVFNAGGLQFTITDGATDFGLGASFTMTVPATNVTLQSVWKGASANKLLVEVIGESLGVVFTVAQPSGGLVNPSVQPALDQIGNVWETMILNGLDIEDTTALDALSAFGEGRWGPLVRKPLLAFTGNTKKLVADATAISSVRRTDKVNVQLTAPGSPNLPFVVAARQLARIARVANNIPSHDYGAQRATGLVPGADVDQWNYAQRDAAVKAGSSTIEVRDSVVTIGDVVTFYRPTGEEPPAYRFVKDIVKLQQCIFNLDLEFASAEWDGAALIPDEQPTTEPTAKKPKMAIAAAALIVDNLGLAALISDPEWSKKRIIANIDSQNPNRLNVKVPVKLSGNTNIRDVELEFGFYFGAPSIAA
jgi:phage tail sheath gpL-like